MSSEVETPLTVDRNSAASLAQRLANCEAMLVDALNLIGKQNSVVSAAREFWEYSGRRPELLQPAVVKSRERLWRALEALDQPQSSEYWQLIRAFQHAHPHLPPGRDRDDALHGQATAP